MQFASSQSLLPKPYGPGREKTSAHGFIRLRPHTETATPERAFLPRRAGAHLAPIARAAHALPADGPQGRAFRRLGRGRAIPAGNSRQAPCVQRAVSVETGAHRLWRCSLALQAKLPDGRNGAAPGHAYSAVAAQHFLYFLPLPQGQGSLRPTLGAARR